MSCHLQGLSVLVTRPAAQADKLCQLIEAAHGRPVRFPVMEIEPLADTDAAQQLLGALQPSSLLIFVSANAVHHAFPLLPDELPLDAQIAAVGRATAQALRELGLEPSLLPAQGFNSEALLELPQLQHPEHVIIVRGEGGRELLKNELERRGAKVEYAEVYRRTVPRRKPDNLLRNWEQLVQAVVLTSVQMLDNLLQILGEQGTEKLRHTPIVVISERVARRAYELGCRKLWIAPEPDDQAILDTLCELRWTDE